MIDDGWIGERADEVAAAVFRDGYSRPGVLVVPVPVDDSLAFRRVMVRLGEAIGSRYADRYGPSLGFAWLMRFDMRNTGTLHRDQCHDASLLVLGYEPTQTVGQVFVADAEDGEKRALQIDRTGYSIVVLNNGVATPGPDARGMVGVFHQGVIDPERAEDRRVVNSICLATGLSDADDTAFFSDQVL